ncbi:hypothetical protein ASG51_14560 [Methylobacterium sp. Leaf465]|nr:hypothetical protein ASG51_14560 [Methylobacterium sp. Leaf465]
MAARPERLREYQGFIKVRLAHSRGRSYLIPDVLIAVAGSRYFFPSFFSPPRLVFDIELGRHFVDFDMDVGAPRADLQARIKIRARSEDRIRSYPDGAQLYRCTILGPRRLHALAKGECRQASDGDYSLRVYHHTACETVPKIEASGVLWSSSWNLAGTRELANVSYGYFTTLPNIRDRDDLARVAMATTGIIHMQTTSDRPVEDVLDLRVLRRSTNEHSHAMVFDVPCGLVAPCHLLFHPFARGQPAYYEVMGPEIVRVGVKPGVNLLIQGRNISVAEEDMRRFTYVVAGDASSVTGLEAPFKEDETEQVGHLDQLNDETDLFDFWIAHRNSDQVSGREIDPRLLKPR